MGVDNWLELGMAKSGIISACHSLVEWANHQYGWGKVGGIACKWCKISMMELCYEFFLHMYINENLNLYAFLSFELCSNCVWFSSPSVLEYESFYISHEKYYSFMNLYRCLIWGGFGCCGMS